nr:CvpA family protein [Criibacterium bergeronii]
MIIYNLYNILIFGKRGLLKSAIVSVGFALKILITYFIYTSGLFEQISKNDSVISFINWIKELLFKQFPALNLAKDSLDGAIVVVLIYIILTIIFWIIYPIFRDVVLSKDDMNLGDKFFGAVLGFIKATIFIMFIIYVLDKVPSTVFKSNIHQFIANSKLITPYFTYNIFMNIFGA